MHDVQLTANFRLSEFAVSKDYPELAAGITFSDVEVERIRLLCAVFLQPLRDQFGQVIITSGKRTPELNRAVGGAPHSHHLYEGDKGAVDFYAPAVTVHDAANRLRLRMPYFRRLIIYEGSNFLHLELPNSDGVYGTVLRTRE